MIYGSVCSGIEAATVAWHPLGWKPAFFAEIDRFPSNVLKHHYPTVPNAGDFTVIGANDYGAIDILVGGTPCQDFSVAGLRAGLDGNRGQLTIEFARLAGRIRPRWLVWENVPGVLSIDRGRAFGMFLGHLGKLGYGFAYRVLDAQHFGVPQRRRRVFVVGHLGDWRRAAAVLFERHSLSGNPAPRREARKVAPPLPSRRSGGGGLGGDFDYDGGLIAGTIGATMGRRGWPEPEVCIASTGDIAYCLNAGGMGRQDYETETVIVTAPLTQNPYADNESRESLLVAHALRGEGFDASEDGTGRGTPLVSVAYRTAGDGCVYEEGEQTAPLTTGTDNSANIVAMNLRGRDGGAMPELDDLASIRAASGGSSRSHVAGMAVRRLTPRECERLQGFPDDYTKISDKTADGPRYKALGNSMAVPVMRWIGERIQMVEEI